MFGRLFTLLLVVAVVAWLLRRRRTPESEEGAAGPAGFGVTFRAGRVASSRGSVPRAPFNAFVDIAALAELDGEVTLDGDGRLAFSASVPERVRQQMRNAWFASAAR